MVARKQDFEIATLREAAPRLPDLRNDVNV
jgi:hypothetical protein